MVRRVKAIEQPRREKLDGWEALRVLGVISMVDGLNPAVLATAHVELLEVLMVAGDQEVGEGVSGFEKGDAYLVYGPVGCQRCKACSREAGSICSAGRG